MSFQGHIVRYESIAAYVAHARDVPKIATPRGGTWDLGVTGARACHLALSGDTSLVQAASECMAQVEAANMTLAMQASMAPSLMGGCVNVPAYLNGAPMCMRRRMKREVSTRHVNVYVNLLSWSECKASDLLRRGAAILALLESLQAARISCDLYLVCGSSQNRRPETDYYVVIGVESRPLDLSVAGFAIAHPAFPRNVIYRDLRHTGKCDSGIPYPSNWNDVDAERAALGLAPGDIYVPMVRHDDDPTIRDGAKWVNTHMSQILSNGGSHEHA